MCYAVRRLPALLLQGTRPKGAKCDPPKVVGEAGSRAARCDFRHTATSAGWVSSVDDKGHPNTPCKSSSNNSPRLVSSRQSLSPSHIVTPPSPSSSSPYGPKNHLPLGTLACPRSARAPSAQAPFPPPRRPVLVDQGRRRHSVAGRLSLTLTTTCPTRSTLSLSYTTSSCARRSCAPHYCSKHPFLPRRHSTRSTHSRTGWSVPPLPLHHNARHHRTHRTYPTQHPPPHHSDPPCASPSRAGSPRSSKTSRWVVD